MKFSAITIILVLLSVACAVQAEVVLRLTLTKQPTNTGLIEILKSEGGISYSIQNLGPKSGVRDAEMLVRNNLVKLMATVPVQSEHLWSASSRVPKEYTLKPSPYGFSLAVGPRHNYSLKKSVDGDSFALNTLVGLLIFEVNRSSTEMNEWNVSLYGGEAYALIKIDDSLTTATVTITGKGYKIGTKYEPRMLVLVIAGYVISRELAP